LTGIIQLEDLVLEGAADIVGGAFSVPLQARIA
jgi:hypothetical protein